MQFSKYQALGNDYLVVERSDSGDILSPSLVRRVCDRHLGIGSDGILVREPSSDSHEFRLSILNPDGSEAEKSGNGLRIFARYLWDKRLVSDVPFKVVTPGGAVSCQVREQGRSVTVEMGQVRFHTRDIPVLGAAREVIRETMEIAGQSLQFTAATIGNPHCVILRQQVSMAEAKSLGPLIEPDSRFPNRTNVQFMQVLDRANVKIEIWERGAGYTLASGSSGCAAAAVAKRLGLCDSSITVHMPGGVLAIEVNEEFFVRMTGPVGKVAEGRLDDEILGCTSETLATKKEIRHRTVPHVTFRRTTTADLEFVLAAESAEENRPFILQWPRDQHIAAINSPAIAHRIVEDSSSGKAVGYVILGVGGVHSSIEFRRLVVTAKGSGYGRAAVRRIKKVAFEELTAHRLWLDVKEFNQRARRLYESEGFTPEGILRECIRGESRWESVYVMSILALEYRGESNVVP